MINAGMFVNSDRRIAHNVVLPRPFSAKISVKRRSDTSPIATQFLKRPTFLIELMRCSTVMPLSLRSLRNAERHAFQHCR